jgi:methionine synthase I (cobalamin-dependent)
MRTFPCGLRRRRDRYISRIPGRPRRVQSRRPRSRDQCEGRATRQRDSAAILDNGSATVVAGSMGPTTKLPSLGHIGFDAMVAAYEEQALALIEGGVDILLIETAQDLLQVKIATIGVLEAMQKSGKRLPLQVQVTLQDERGAMLLGTEIGAALTGLARIIRENIGSAQSLVRRGL